eukprot:1158954-Pelagomonas_calceolata.AAC.3
MRRFVCLASRVARSSSGAAPAQQWEQAADGLHNLSNKVTKINLHVWADGAREHHFQHQSRVESLPHISHPLPSSIQVRLFSEELRVL